MLRKLNVRQAFPLLLLFGFALAFLFGVAGWDIRPVHETGRDLGRAIEIANGNLIWFGPEFKYGGYSPGPFLYWLTSLPFLFGGTWHAVIAFELVLSALAAVALYKLVERRHSQLAAAFAMIFFLNGMVLIRTLNQFWNSSYVFLFDVLLISFFWNFPVPTPKRMVSAGILLGCIIQMHALQALLIFDALVSIFVDARQEIRRRLQVACWLIGGVVLALSPYFLWRIFGGSGDHGAWVAQVLEAPLVADNPAERFRGLMQKGFFQDVFLLSGAIIALAGRGKIRGRPFFLLITAIVTLPIFLKIELESIRYAIPLFFSALLLVSTSLSDVIERRKILAVPFFALVILGLLFRPAIAESQGAPLPQWANAFLVFFAACSLLVFFVMRVRGQGVVVAALLALNLANLASVMQTKADVGRDLDANTARTEQFESMLAAIKGATGWTFEKLRPRLYITGEGDRALSLLYRDVAPDEDVPKISDLDGVIAIYRTPEMRGKSDNIYPEQIKSAIDATRLTCVHEERLEAFDVCFYRGQMFSNFSYFDFDSNPHLELNMELPLRGTGIKFSFNVLPTKEQILVQLDATFFPTNPMLYGEFNSIHFDCLCDGRREIVSLAPQVYSSAAEDRLQPIRIIGKAPCMAPTDASIMIDRIHFYRRDGHIEKYFRVGGPLRFTGIR